MNKMEDDMIECIENAMAVVERINGRYSDKSPELSIARIATTFFIQRRREDYWKRK